MVFLITWCIVAALTVGIYLLLFPIYGHLFGLNLAVALGAEALGIYAISMVTSKETLTPQKASLRQILLVYAIVIFLWTTICSIASSGSDGPYILIYCGLIVITLIAALLYGLGAAGGKVVSNQENQLAQAVSTRVTTLYPLDTWLQKISKDIGDGEDAQALLSEARVTIDTIKTIPSRKLLDNSQFIEYINRHTQSIEEQANMINNCENRQEIMQQMLASIIELKNNIKNFNNQ